MKLSEIQDLIKFVAKSGVSEVDLETKDVKINIKTLPKGYKGVPETTVVATTVPVAAAAPQAAVPQVAVPVATQEAPAKAEKPVVNDKISEVKSPMIGTFYRSPSPDKPAFVNVGDEVKKGDVLCIIEAMKLFNEIEAEISGKIVKVLVDDSSPVEYEQPLFLVEAL